MKEIACRDLVADLRVQKSGYRYLEIDGKIRDNKMNAVNFLVRGLLENVWCFMGKTPTKSGVWGKLKNLVIRMVPEITCLPTQWFMYKTGWLIWVCENFPTCWVNYKWFHIFLPFLTFCWFLGMMHPLTCAFLFRCVGQPPNTFIGISRVGTLESWGSYDFSGDRKSVV